MERRKEKVVNRLKEDRGTRNCLCGKSGTLKASKKANFIARK